jgi:hypothetical protein
LNGSAMRDGFVWINAFRKLFPIEEFFKELFYFWNAR